MQYKVSEIEGLLLDAAVDKAEGLMPAGGAGWLGLPGQCREYSSDWRDGGPIIERERINLAFLTVDDDPLRAAWCAYLIGSAVVDPGHYIDTYPDEADAQGETPLIAAMRAYVASRYGDVVDLP